MKNKADAGKDKSADRLASFVSSLAKSETNSPNSAMPPPEMLEAFAKIDKSMPLFFKNEFEKQVRHERRMEVKIALRNFTLKFLDYGLPVLCVIALIIVALHDSGLLEKILLGMMVIIIYALRLARALLFDNLKKQPAKSLTKPPLKKS